MILDPTFWRGRRVLLTGHTGFKGSWLTLWLMTLGADVWGYSLVPDPVRSLFTDLALDQSHDNSNWGRLCHLTGDIRDLQTLKQVVSEVQPEVVLHLAAQPLVRSSYRDPLGTWSTNLLGSLNLLEALRPLRHRCAVVMVTTDKVYANQEWDYGYREDDRLGGHDPYSASKAGAEIAIASWRSSFCGSNSHQTTNLAIATARAGNVIGGGDWAEDRIVPDVIRSLAADEVIQIRRPEATRPWQHVLEPLSGYLCLAQVLSMGAVPPCEAFNFGPKLESNRSVRDLVTTIFEYWPGKWVAISDLNAPHEAKLLHLQIDKAYKKLNWSPRWEYDYAVSRTIGWYRAFFEGVSPLKCCLADLDDYLPSCH